MTDIMSASERSRLMSRVKSQDTGPEMRLRRALWQQGLRYRVHFDLPGRPDLTFIGKRVAVFVDGCFWHCCPEHGTHPEQNGNFWRRKLAGNRGRDRRVNEELQASGWTVLRLWEHEVTPDALPDAIEKVKDALADAGT